MLVAVGSQLLGNFVDMVRSGAGFPTEHLLACVVIPENQRYPTPERKAAVYRRFLETVRTLPGVASVGTVNALPFSGENLGGYLSLRESPEPREQLVGEVDVVSAEYLQTMGVRLIEGRWFSDADMNKDSTAVIVDEVAAKHLWPHTSPIGKTVCVNCVPENPRNWKQVIGVVSNIHHASLDRPPQPNAYLSSTALEQAVFMVVRTNRPTGELEKTIRTAIAAVDPDQPVLLSASMQAFIGDSIADRRFIMTLLVVTGCLALLVASAGVCRDDVYDVEKSSGIRHSDGSWRHTGPDSPIGISPSLRQCSRRFGARDGRDSVRHAFPSWISVFRGYRSFRLY
jgi:MacB-like periplasmic core domain